MVKTFGKHELEEKLRKYFTSINFYYPYPDYKLPDCVVSHDFLSSGRAGELVSQIKSRDYIREKKSLWNESFVSLARIRQAVEKARLRTEKEIAIVGVPTDGLDPAKAQEHSDGYAKIFNQAWNKGRDAVNTLVHVLTVPFNALKQKKRLFIRAVLTR